MGSGQYLGMCAVLLFHDEVIDRQHSVGRRSLSVEHVSTHNVEMLSKDCEGMPANIQKYDVFAANAVSRVYWCLTGSVQKCCRSSSCYLSFLQLLIELAGYLAEGMMRSWYLCGRHPPDTVVNVCIPSTPAHPIFMSTHQTLASLPVQSMCSEWTQAALWQRLLH